MTSLVELTDVSKHYGTVRALEGVSLEVHPGEITCVLGDNGAGKSTLIKIVAGLHRHDGGTLRVEGEETTLSSPREALDRGIATVYQDLAVVPLMPVWRNFFLGSEPRRGVGPFKRLDIDLMRRTTREALLRLASTSGTSTSPSAPSRAANASAWPSPARSTSAPRS